jgi:peptide chain release factor 2
LAQKKEKIKELELKTQEIDFWKDQESAAQISQELSQMKEEVDDFEKIKNDLNDLAVLSEEMEEDESLEEETIKLKERLDKKEFQVFLSGKYDRKNALLSIFAGAGGREAQDWTTMLIRMYEKYCQSAGYKFKILDQSYGEAGGPEGRIGLKSVTAEIQGKFAYGYLKKETGVHRLVRVSPFSAQNLRHTSFALVEVLPNISDKDAPEIEIKPDDLKVDTFRSSGPGGQNVNKRETAVRITHLPTGIIVSCQVERTQPGNKEKAMNVLIAKLYQLDQENRSKELKQVKGDKIEAGWGNQIRSYVLHPYKMIKDLRTDIETSDTDGVLNGDLEEFIKAEIKY